MMSGANPAAVQRIMRHTDPRITTETYGHLTPNYLRAEVDRLSFGLPLEVEAAPVRRSVGTLARGPQSAAPFAATLLQASQGANVTRTNGPEIPQDLQTLTTLAGEVREVPPSPVRG